MPGGGSLNPPSAETVAKKMHYVHQDGQAVYKFAVRKMSEATEKLLERNGVRGSDLDCFIPHQANKRIIVSTAERLGMAPERVIINIDSSAIPPQEPFRWRWRRRAKRTGCIKEIWSCWRPSARDIRSVPACCAGKFNGPSSRKLRG